MTVTQQHGDGMMRRILGGFVLVALTLAIGYFGGEFRFEAGSLPPLDSVPSVIHSTEPRVMDSSHSESPPIPASYLENPLKYLSEAPKDSLQLLPGIGPVLAERLASARSGRSSFTVWEQLLGVKGIGPKKLQKLRNLAGERGERASDRR